MFFSSLIMFYLNFFLFLECSLANISSASPQSSDRTAVLHFIVLYLIFCHCLCYFLVSTQWFKNKTQGRTKQYEQFIEMNGYHSWAKRDVIQYKSHQGEAADESSCEVGWTWSKSVNPKETKERNGRP